MDNAQPKRYKPIIKGAIIGGVAGLIGFFIAPLGLQIVGIELLRPVLVPGIDLIVNPFFSSRGAIMETSRLMTLGIIFNVLIYATLGVIVASVGSSKKSLNTNRAKKVLIIGLIVIYFLGLIGRNVSGYLNILTLVCDSEKSSVFSEFPHYGNIQLEPRTVKGTGDCRGDFSSSDSVEQVLEYYEEELIAHGWVIEKFEIKGAFFSLIAASKGNYYYKVRIAENKKDFNEFYVTTGGVKGF